jgi:hypothetical protein
MPNRILRDWTDSDAVNTLSADAERLFTRLIMKADDYGLFTANPTLIRTSCFPMLVDSVRNDAIARWLKELAKAQLIVIYEADGKQFLCIRWFDQRLKYSVAKHPAPPAELVPEFPESGRKLNRVCRNASDTSGNFRELPGTSGKSAQTSGNFRELPGSRPTLPGTSGNFPLEVEVEVEVEREVEEEEKEDCPEPQAASGPPALLSFPVKANHGNPWHFTTEHCKRLQDAFSGIDIMAEARKSLSWLEAHSDRRKTAKGMPTFLHSWMTRANDSGRAAKVDDTPDIFAASRQEVSVEEARRILGHGEAA